MNTSSKQTVLRLIVQLMTWALVGLAAYAIGSAASSFDPPLSMAVGWGTVGVLLFLWEAFSEDG